MIVRGKHGEVLRSRGVSNFLFQYFVLRRSFVTSCMHWLACLHVQVFLSDIRFYKAWLALWSRSDFKVWQKFCRHHYSAVMRKTRVPGCRYWNWVRWISYRFILANASRSLHWTFIDTKTSTVLCLLALQEYTAFVPISQIRKAGHLHVSLIFSCFNGPWTCLSGLDISARLLPVRFGSLWWVIWLL